MFQEVEDERYIFMSSMLGLLAEYGIFPRVANASTLTHNVKVLTEQVNSTWEKCSFILLLSVIYVHYLICIAIHE